MKFKRFCVNVGVSFALISGSMTVTSLAQAQSDMTTDFTQILVPTDRVTFTSDTFNDFVDLVSSDLIKHLESGAFCDLNAANCDSDVDTIEFQQKLASLLQNSEEDRGFLIQALIDDGIPENLAEDLAGVVAGLLSEVPDGDLNQQADQLTTAITDYNNLINDLETAILEEPPSSLLIIRQVLLEASNATRSGDE